MKAIDFRNATYHGLRSQLEGLRRDVYAAWVQHGPMTTRQLALKCGIDLLTLRPRTTELLQLGLVEVVEFDVERSEFGVQSSPDSASTLDPLPSGEGVYRAVFEDKWNRWREGIINHQMQLI